MKGYPSIKRGETATIKVAATGDDMAGCHFAITIKSGNLYKTLPATLVDGNITAELDQATSLKLSETEPTQIQGRVIDSDNKSIPSEIYGLDVEHTTFGELDVVSYE